MPELSALNIAILAATIIIGVIVGWVLRGKRSRDEKAAVSAGWQEQIGAQRAEHDRLTDQNKGLMEQINQYQASNTDAKNRARELSEAVQEAYARRDRLQLEIKNVRARLEKSISEHDQLRSDMREEAGATDTIRKQDLRIAKLQTELENWQNRLPPLIDKFRQRNADAEQLEASLAAARRRVAELEATGKPDQTRIEAVQNPGTLTEGRSASNDPIDPIDPIDNEPEHAPRAGAASDDSRDELQAIKGVGPAIEKTLNEMGIFRFQQIAEMSEYEIDQVAERLKGFRTRIYREDWIGQARELRDQEADR